MYVVNTAPCRICESPHFSRCGRAGVPAGHRIGCDEFLDQCTPRCAEGSSGAPGEASGTVHTEVIRYLQEHHIDMLVLGGISESTAEG